MAEAVGLGTRVVAGHNACASNRAMEFIQVFISEVAKGEQSLDTAAGKPAITPTPAPKHVYATVPWSHSGIPIISRNGIRQDFKTVSQLDC